MSQSIMVRLNEYQFMQGCILMLLAFSYLIFHYSAVLKKHGISSSVDFSSSQTNSITTTSLSSSKSLVKYKVCAFSSLGYGAYMLPQWIDYHTLAGIDQFFLVNICDGESMKKSFWLKLYASLGLVTEPNYVKNDICLRSNHANDELEDVYSKAKDSCEWLVPLEVDEYLNPSQEFSNSNLLAPSVVGTRKSRAMIQNIDTSFLKTLLSNSTEAIYRLPMYAMSSHMYENHTTSLLIDQFLNGLFTGSTKLLVKTEHLTKLEKDAKISLKKGAKLTVLSVFMSHRLESELAPLSAEKSMCLIPTTAIYIKHFEAQSFEDYMLISRDKDKSREKWVKQYFKRRCPLLNEATKKVMSKKMLGLFYKNYQSYCHQILNTTIVVPVESVKNWLNADSLSCSF